MIENVIKKYLKRNGVHEVEGCGYYIKYKINVKVSDKVIPYSNSKRTYIDLNIKIIDCRRKIYYNELTSYNIFQLGGRSRKGDYQDVRMVVRNDINNWFAPMFSTYLYRDCYTQLCGDTQIRVNTFTFK